MSYLILYICIGILSFWPAMLFDKETHDEIKDSLGISLLAWAVWSIFWMPSCVCDLLFWMVGEPDDGMD